MNRCAWGKMFVAAVLGALVASGCATLMETEVSLDQVPAAAKAAIEKETAGGVVREIEKERCCGQVAYDVDYVKDGRKIEVKFAEDGTVMKCGEHDGSCGKCGK
jgi:hypothetical protein